MKKLALNLATVSVLAVAAQATAWADDVTNSPFRVKAGVGLANYTSPSTGAPDIKLDYQTLNLGASYVDASSGRFIDFTNRSTLGSANWNAGTVFASAGAGITDAPATRTENTLTIGKALADGLQVFGGYQVSEASLNLDLRNNQNIVAAAQNNYIYTLQMSGFFVGAGKALPVGDGTLNITAALAMMSAKTNSILDTRSGVGHTYAAGLGYSLGASWSYPVSNTLSVVPEAKIQSYKPQDYGSADTLTTLGVNVISKF